MSSKRTDAPVSAALTIESRVSTTYRASSVVIAPGTSGSTTRAATVSVIMRTKTTSTGAGSMITNARSAKAVVNIAIGAASTNATRIAKPAAPAAASDVAMGASGFVSCTPSHAPTETTSSPEAGTNQESLRRSSRRPAPTGRRRVTAAPCMLIPPASRGAAGERRSPAEPRRRPPRRPCRWCQPQADTRTRSTRRTRDTR